MVFMAPPTVHTLQKHGSFPGISVRPLSSQHHHKVIHDLVKLSSDVSPNLL